MSRLRGRARRRARDPGWVPPTACTSDRPAAALLVRARDALRYTLTLPPRRSSVHWRVAPPRHGARVVCCWQQLHLVFGCTALRAGEARRGALPSDSVIAIPMCPHEVTVNPWKKLPLPDGRRRPGLKRAAI